MPEVHVIAYVVVSAIAFVLALALIAWILFCADWFDVGDFTDSQLQSRIDAAFKENES